MQKEDIKFQNSLYFEGMTSIRAIIKGNESGINDRHINNVYYDGGKMRKIAKEVGYLKAVSKEKGFEVEEVNADFLDNITLGNSHGGLVALASQRTIPSLRTDCILPSGFYALLDGIEDPYNFGYALRSLYACGCDGIILGKRNWYSAAGVLSRSSAGASELFPAFSYDSEDCLDLFKEKNYSIVCAEEKTDNILGKCSLKRPLLLVIGGEKRGISKKIIEKSDMLVKIPYSRAFYASLSAASAATMFAYEIMRQNL